MTLFLARLWTRTWPRLRAGLSPVRLGRAYVDTYRGLPQRVWLLCLVFLINRAGTMVLPFLSLYATEELDFSPAHAAAILVAFGLGSLVGSYLGGRLTRRLGVVAVQKGSLVGAAAAFTTLPLFDSVVPLAAAVFVASFFGDAFRPAAMTAVAEAAPDGTRTRSLALIRLAANLGFAIGPAIGGLLAGISYDLLFYGDALTCLAAAGALALWVPEMESWEERSRRPAPQRRAWADGPFLLFLIAIFLLGCSLFQIAGALPVFLHQGEGLSESTIGLLLAMTGLLIVLLEMPLVKALERFPPMRMVAVGGFLLCGGFALHAVAESVFAIALVMATWTLGEMISLPFSNAIAAGRGGPGSGGEYMGLYMVAFSIASLVGPAGGLWVYQRYGDALWLGIGAFAPVVLLICAALMPYFRQALPEAHAEADGEKSRLS